MRTLSIDIETFSSVSLITAGLYAYAESPDFEVLLFGYAFDDDDVQVIDFTDGKRLTPGLVEALIDPNVVKTAFNAAFERTCLSAALGLALPPDQWSCTAVRAAELGLPRSLADVGKVIGLPVDQQKAADGKSLIRYFSIPCKATKTNGQRTRNLPQHDLEKWRRYIEYNRQDVIAEREIRRRLSKMSVHPFEQTLWEHDQRINARGVQVDLLFAQNALDFDARCKEELEEQAKQLTGLTNPKSTAQLKAWIEDSTGVPVESLNKKAMAGVREETAHCDEVQSMLDLRAGLSRTSNAKYEKMLETACEDGRIRGMSRFYGASRTGRWSGQLVQLQNLPQNKLPDKNFDIARQLVNRGDYDTFSMLYDDVPGTLSQLIRTAFVPRTGHRFIVADFSAIEARVIAWLAGEQWRMDIFNTHGKIYEASAEQMFHLPPGSVKPGDPMRQKGKIAELALGFGGAVGALINMGALEKGLKESELLPLVQTWRRANPAIVKYWWDIDKAMRSIIRTGVSCTVRNVSFRKEGSILRLALPSGRELSYVKPAIVDDNITYEGTHQTSGAWGRIESYGPKVVENIVQATARDCLAVGIDRLERAGLPIVFHVHDEVICEVETGRSSAEEVAALITEPIPWAVGLPLKAAAFECGYYRKD